MGTEVGSAQAYLKFCLRESLSLVQWWSNGDGESVGPICGVCYPLCCFSLLVAASLAWAQGIDPSLGRVNLDFLLLGWCTAVHSWPVLPGQGSGMSCFLLQKGNTISPCACSKGRRDWFEHSLRLHLQNWSRAQELEIAVTPIGLSGTSWTGELNLTWRAETKVICGFLPFLLNMNREWFFGWSLGKECHYLRRSHLGNISYR